MKKKLTLFLLLSFILCFDASPESGYEAWLRYAPVEDPIILREYQSLSGRVFVFGNSEILNSALDELKYGISEMTGTVPLKTGKYQTGNIIIGKTSDIPGSILTIPGDQMSKLTQEGYLIIRKGKRIVITGKSVIRYIYDTHNDGVEEVKNYVTEWQSLAGLIDSERYENILNRLKQQVKYAEVWRDSINSYFFHLSGIEERHN